MVAKHIHLIVEEGPEKGREITVRPEGIRVGRSSNNDVVLNDPAMSRFHCRFVFKPGSGLWAEDLGSANQTLLNDKPLHEAQLHNGDRLAIGDTIIKVVNVQAVEAPPAKLFDLLDSTKDRIKTEFKRTSAAGEGPKRRNTLLLTLVVLLAIATGVIWIQKTQRQSSQAIAPVVGESLSELEIDYEKVQASAKNIFRYELELTQDELSIQIDDLLNRRHVSKTQHKKVEKKVIRSMVDTINNSGFFEMKEIYKGLPTDFWEVYDLSITIGRKTHRVKILNTIEPEAFKDIREAIELFGQNELGLAALALTPQKLMELARSAVLLGRTLYDQRKVKYENLFLAIRSLKEVEYYLETVEPKPDFYAQSAALCARCKQELDENYRRHLFLAGRAIRLKDWSEAASQLRIICERIPDRSDERHKDARKQLLDVERHLKRK